MTESQRVHSLVGAGPEPPDESARLRFRVGRRAAWNAPDHEWVATGCAGDVERRDPITTES